MKMLRLFLIVISTTINILSFSQTGILDIKTIPEGATVFVGNVNYGESPITLTLPTGNHVVMVTLPTFQDQKINVRIEENIVTKKEIIFKKKEDYTTGTEGVIEIGQNTGNLTITTNPVDANIVLDNRGVDGKSPLTIYNLAEGYHVVKVKKRIEINGKYTNQEVEKKLYLNKNKNNIITIDFFKELPRFTISSNPESSVYVDGKEIGKTPKNKIYTTPGYHKILLSVDLPFPYSNNFEVNLHENFTQGKTYDFYIDFFEKFKLGNLEIKSNQKDYTIGLKNTTFYQFYTIPVGYNDRFLVGRYSFAKPKNDYLRNESFWVKKDTLTSIFIPVYFPLQRERIIAEHPDYSSLQDFLYQTYIPLDEGYVVKRPYVKWKNRSGAAYAGAFLLWSAGFVELIGAFFNDKNPELNVLVAAGCTAIPFIWLTKTREKFKANQKNVQRNKDERLKIEKDYQQLVLQWEKDVKLSM